MRARAQKSQDQAGASRSPWPCQLFSRLRCCTGDKVRGTSMTTSPISFSLISSRKLATVPLPSRLAGRGRAMRAISARTTSRWIAWARPTARPPGATLRSIGPGLGPRRDQVLISTPDERRARGRSAEPPLASGNLVLYPVQDCFALPAWLEQLDRLRRHHCRYRVLVETSCEDVRRAAAARKNCRTR